MVALSHNAGHQHKGIAVPDETFLLQPFRDRPNGGMSRHLDPNDFGGRAGRLEHAGDAENGAQEEQRHHQQETELPEAASHSRWAPLSRRWSRKERRMTAAASLSITRRRSARRSPA